MFKEHSKKFLENIMVEIFFYWFIKIVNDIKIWSFSAILVLEKSVVKNQQILKKFFYINF